MQITIYDKRELLTVSYRNPCCLPLFLLHKTTPPYPNPLCNHPTLILSKDFPVVTVTTAFRTCPPPSVAATEQNP
jgi:hypothetical protein